MHAVLLALAFVVGTSPVAADLTSPSEVPGHIAQLNAWRRDAPP